MRSLRLTQDLVNAQVAVSRAVFEANKKDADPLAIDLCIADALESLAQAQKLSARERWRQLRTGRRMPY